MAGKCNEICLENHGLEYDRKLKQKQLDIATKGLREMIIKQNTRDFRREQQDKAARRSKEYGKVLFEVSWSFSWHHKVEFDTRSHRETEMIRSEDWSKGGQKKTWRDGERTARGFTGINALQCSGQI